MSRWTDRRRDVVLTVAVLLLTALAAVFAALATADAGRQVLWWILGGTCLVLLVVPQRLEVAAGRHAAEVNKQRVEAMRQEVQDAAAAERQTRLELSMAVNTLFQDIASNLGEMLSRPAEERRARRADMITGCLNAASAARLLGCQDARANFYLLDGDGNLEPVASKGRPPAATTKFIVGTVAHRGAMRMLQDSDYIFSRDTAHDAPEGFSTARHHYRTFVSVPVRTKQRLYGMLTIDAKTPGDLQEEHVELARMLGHFLAATLAAAPTEADPL